METESNEYAGYPGEENMPTQEPPVPQEIIRVLKIVEYIGERNVVEQSLRHGQGPYFATSRMIINTAILGTFPEVLDGSAAQAIRETLKAQQVYDKLVEDEKVAEDRSLYLAQKQASPFPTQVVQGPGYPGPVTNWPKILSNAKPSTKKI